MRVVFMGSAAMSCPALKALGGAPGVDLVGVVTQPDRPKGRHLGVTPCDARRVAEAADWPVLAPPRVNTPESLAALRIWRPDLLVVVAYGQLLGRELLALPARGCINLHTSLLPAYRGAAPIQWAVANGETRTGITTMLMNAEMDAGDILLQEVLAIGPEETAGQLHDRMAVLGATLLVNTVAAWGEGRLTPRPQDHTAATLAPKLRKQDGEIDWTRPARDLYNRLRGFDPWPGSFCRLPAAAGGAPLKVLRVAVEAATGTPGEVLDVNGPGPLIAAGEGALRLLKVQACGGSPMNADAYLRGHPLALGTRMLS